MAMTTKKKESNTPVYEKKVTTLITSDMVLDLYAKAKKAKGSEKKILMDRVVFLSQHLNHYTPIVPSHYSA
jgi:hypothetical protein